MRILVVEVIEVIEEETMPGIASRSATPVDRRATWPETAIKGHLRIATPVDSRATSPAVAPKPRRPVTDVARLAILPVIAPSQGRISKTCRMWFATAAPRLATWLVTAPMILLK